ncbi:MAG: hypothetical protein ACD_11C00017G0031 [uncultured bacterium]|nr:MAG: hypothetical protein ACD_11C00017G0031 [uncultured bacterium]HBR71517.1 hypothetical protein [Candidatus Moranbacteria bacterium]
MDIISHGLWGGVTFGRKNKRNFFLAFLFGILPDMFSFGILWIANILGLSQRPDWSQGTPAESLIPDYVHYLYNATHSLVVFLAVFALMWLIFKKPFWLMGAWGLHILIDIPSHSLAFFATPFLWPLSNYRFDGISWGNPTIFFPNLILLASAYLFWFIYRKKNKINT